MRRLLALALLAGGAVACENPTPRATGSPWPEADALFRGDALWIGGDGAFSVDLGAGRVLWLFGDSFVAKGADRSRDDCYFVRNSVAIETGYDPSRAFMAFYWADRGGAPGSFVPEQGGAWFWPEQGAMVDGRLLLLYQRVTSAESTGFASDGSVAMLVANPGDEPPAWTLAPAAMPLTSFGVTIGNGTLVSGGFLYTYGDLGTSTHDHAVLRVAVADAAAGDLSGAAWWAGGAWVATAALAGKPDVVVADAAPEFTVRFDPRSGKFLMVQGEGYGATTLALRSADAPEGPWSSPEVFFRPEESFAFDAFVYAGKGHDGLVGADLVATYVASSFPGTPQALDDNLYYPRFVRVSVSP